MSVAPEVIYDFKQVSGVGSDNVLGDRYKFHLGLAFWSSLGGSQRKGITQAINKPYSVLMVPFLKADFLKGVPGGPERHTL